MRTTSTLSVECASCGAHIEVETTSRTAQTICRCGANLVLVWGAGYQRKPEPPTITERLER